MRLLSTHALRFAEFTIPPPYAILSRRWGGEEVIYVEYCAEARPPGLRWTKMLDCCEIARSRKHRYVWIDSCCIDKRSSAEISEAIAVREDHGAFVRGLTSRLDARTRTIASEAST
ncbi:hypothetical protein EJ03DRAFT_314775, partial [Teratosphaeria nubilosa]